MAGVQPNDKPPLKVSCVTSDCDNDLHCFKKSRSMPEAQRGECRSCGVKLVNWKRIHRRSLQDIDFTLASLKHEWIRHHFWHQPIDHLAETSARKKGLQKLKEDAARRIERSVGRGNPSYDGRQTPFEGNILYYAQHATACCCRTCMEYWHGIPKGTDLTPADIAYFQGLVVRYVVERVPDLDETL